MRRKRNPKSQASCPETLKTCDIDYLPIPQTDSVSVTCELFTGNYISGLLLFGESIFEQREWAVRSQLRIEGPPDAFMLHRAHWPQVFLAIADASGNSPGRGDKTADHPTRCQVQDLMP
jgi:hypothetical protein